MSGSGVSGDESVLCGPEFPIARQREAVLGTRSFWHFLKKFSHSALHTKESEDSLLFFVKLN